LHQSPNGEIEFYNLLKDRHELNNVHGQPEHRAAEAKLLEFLERRKF
jgi:hypothetical protein